jgi:hypothetical protein
MKNQYFGDINDYKKYGILRALSEGGKIKIGVCWMLTDDDDKNEGQFTNYIHQPDKWRNYDRLLFDSLNYSLTELKIREVALAEQLNLLENSYYHQNLLDDSSLKRELYFQEFKDNISDCDLLFFDPDNGIEVKAKPFGRKDSSKYIYWREILQYYRGGYSLLIYQHFPRIKREIFIENLSKELKEKIKVDNIVFYETSNVLFILLPQKRKKDYFIAVSKKIQSEWYPEIKCKIFDTI